MCLKFLPVLSKPFLNLLRRRSGKVRKFDTLLTNDK